MAQLPTITSIRTILRSVDGYEKNSSAPSITKDKRTGRFYIHFHHFGQIRLASNCEKKLRDNGLTVWNFYPDLVVEPYI